jgi:hypothetical protein
MKRMLLAASTTPDKNSLLATSLICINIHAQGANPSQKDLSYQKDDLNPIFNFSQYPHSIFKINSL